MKRFLVLAQTVVLKLATIGSIGNINGLSARDEGRRGGALASSFDQSLPRPTQGRAPEWRLGTVSRVDGAASQLVLTDGSLVRVTPATNIHRHEQRLTVDQIPAGSEVVIQAVAPASGAVAGSALPRQTATAAVIDAAEVAVMWTPTASSR